MKNNRKYMEKLNWLAGNTRPDIIVYVINSARSQKRTKLKY